MNRQFIVAILLVVAAPVYAHAQNLRVGDAQKVVTIISSDRIKTASRSGRPTRRTTEK
jgi:hypothetical protein